MHLFHCSIFCMYILKASEINNAEDVTKLTVIDVGILLTRFHTSGKGAVQGAKELFGICKKLCVKEQWYNRQRTFVFKM